MNSAIDIQLRSLQKSVVGKWVQGSVKFSGLDPCLLCVVSIQDAIIIMNPLQHRSFDELHNFAVFGIRAMERAVESGAAASAAAEVGKASLDGLDSLIW